MAVQQYGTTSANNQNTAARPQQQAQSTWQPTQLPTYQSSGYNPYGGAPRSSAYTSPWGNQQAQSSGTGPYNPNPGGYQPSQLSPWSPQQPQRPTYTPYTPATSPTPTAPNAWTPANFNTPALQSQNTSYMSTVLPWMQMQQNNYQYQNDFNEAGRRWDTQTQWQQAMDQYNMGLTGRQQQFNEWQGQEAANQWANQFNWQQSNDRFSQDLANRQLAVEQAYNQGRLTNEQRQIALAELTQQQQMGFNREELAATQAYRAQQDALARWQTQQQLEAQRQNALLQATGRASGSGPSAQWMRRF